MSKRGGKAAAGIVALAVLASACSGGSSASSTDPTTASTAPKATSSSANQGTLPPVQLTDAGPLGVKYARTNFETYQPYLARLRGGSTFFELVWCDVEAQQGQQDWSAPDEVAAQAAQLGLRLYLKIRVGSCAITGARIAKGNSNKSTSMMPPDLERYRAFVKQVVERYWPKGVHEYAIENEVNSAGFWGGTAQEYVTLVKAASATIKATQPTAVVLDGGLSSATYGVGVVQRLLDLNRGDQAVATWEQYYERRFVKRKGQIPEVSNVSELRDALQGSQQQRNADYLAATFSLVASGAVDALQVHFYERYSNAPALFEYLRSQVPAQFRIEVWELGMFWPDGPKDAAEQAGETLKLAVSVLAGGASVAIYLPVAADPNGTGADELRFGLLDPSGANRPSGDRYAELATALQGATWSPVSANAGLQGLVAGGPGGGVAVLWSDANGGATVAAGPPSGAKVTDVDGNDVAWPAAGLHVGSQPVLIRTTGGADGLRALLAKGG